MWIMIAGPYTASAATPAERQANLDTLNAAALAVFDKGHVPIVGVNLANPIIRVAGEERFDEIMMPVSLALTERCDAILRLGGSSRGADAEVARFAAAGKPVFHSLDDLPSV